MTGSIWTFFGSWIRIRIKTYADPKHWLLTSFLVFIVGVPGACGGCDGLCGGLPQPHQMCRHHPPPPPSPRGQRRVDQKGREAALPTLCFGPDPYPVFVSSRSRSRSLKSYYGSGSRSSFFLSFSLPEILNNFLYYNC